MLPLNFDGKVIVTFDLWDKTAKMKMFTLTVSLILFVKVSSIQGGLDLDCFLRNGINFYTRYQFIQFYILFAIIFLLNLQFPWVKMFL